MQLTVNEQTTLRNRYGSWAVVTGASSGIGKEISCQLAMAGFNLLLVGRREDALAETARELATVSGAQLRLLPADLAGQAGIDMVIDASGNLNVGLLVASAGYGTSGLFPESDVNQEAGMLRVNCEALMKLTHHFAGVFSRQKRGGIILLSSMVAFQGVPFSANYAATKAYVQALAEGLQRELKPYGVDVLSAAPGPVKSGFEARANMRMTMALTPDQVGVPILKALGKQNTVFPGLLTKVLVYSLQTVPRWAKVRIMEKVMGGMTSHQRVKQPLS